MLPLVKSMQWYKKHTSFHNKALCRVQRIKMASPESWKSVMSSTDNETVN